MTKSSRGNIVYFLSSPELNSLYASRAEKYLQPEFAFYSWQTDTGAQLEALSAKAVPSWDLLVVDAARLQSDAAAIQKFKLGKPGCRILVLGSPCETVLSDVEFEDAPLELDDWLAMMHRHLPGV